MWHKVCASISVPDAPAVLEGGREASGPGVPSDIRASSTLKSTMQKLVVLVLAGASLLSLRVAGIPAWAAKGEWVCRGLGLSSWASPRRGDGSKQDCGLGD
jgi:hypothetical protein